MNIRIGCAGWSISKAHAALFPAAGAVLERYARVFNAVEINTTFYRRHRDDIFARWAGQVPEDFRFAIKAPRSITHLARLRDPGLLDEFLPGPLALGGRLGPLLFELPPSLEYDARTARAFFEQLRARFSGAVVCEPRHASWFNEAASDLLRETRIARAAADPAPCPTAAEPGGWEGLVYYRLHGSPRMYYSPYPREFLGSLAGRIQQIAQFTQAWCIFDNTAAGAATRNAFDLAWRLQAKSPAES